MALILIPARRSVSMDNEEEIDIAPIPSEVEDEESDISAGGSSEEGHRARLIPDGAVGNGLMNAFSGLCRRGRWPATSRHSRRRSPFPAA